jgi:hypothetical protein
MGDSLQVSSIIVLNPQDYFFELVEESCVKLNSDLKEPSRRYLSRLLEFYLDARNLHDPQVNELGERQPTMLSEMLLQSQHLGPAARFELLKKLGDRTLYVSGFFSESLNRKIIDIDFYKDIGETAYYSLSNSVREEELSFVFRNLSAKFTQHSDVLNYISEKTQFNQKDDLMRLYEKYVLTGSQFSKDKLQSLGVIPPQTEVLKRTKQDD